MNRTVERRPVFTRLIACATASLVLLLSLSAVSPELHAWLHESGLGKAATTCPHGHAHGVTKAAQPAQPSADDEDHECAVTLFAHGIVSHAVPPLARPCEGILCAVNYRAFKQLALAQPRYLHLPPQAPPAV